LNAAGARRLSVVVAVAVAFSHFLGRDADAAGPKNKAPIDEPPLVNQPENFSGAIGSFKISATAEPTEIAVGEPIQFTLHVRGTNAARPPQRPDLRRFEKFRRRFQIQDLAEQDKTRPTPVGQEWEFNYRLKPLRGGVKEIPALPFDYYKPGIVPRTKGYFTTYSRSIPLRIKPASVSVVARRRLPERMYEIVTGPSVLRTQQPATLPGTVICLLAVIGPPLACLVWYWVWRRCNRGAAQAARRRRSRAARLALVALQKDGHPDGDARTKHVAQVVQSYLWQRFDLSLTDLTPVAVAEQLRRLGYPDALANQATELFRACDTVRFAGDLASASEKLPASAESLILALESES
jgi:hypothetical protein